MKSFFSLAAATLLSLATIAPHASANVYATGPVAVPAASSLARPGAASEYANQALGTKSTAEETRMGGKVRFALSPQASALVLLLVAIGTIVIAPFVRKRLGA